MKAPARRFVPALILLMAILRLPPALSAGEKWADLKLEIECPKTADLEKGFEVSMRGFVDEEIRVQVVQAVLPDEFTSISVRQHNSDELYLRHPAMENRAGGGRRFMMPSNYGRYEIPLQTPAVTIANRPASKQRPLDVRFWVRPAKTGTFRVQVHTATRSEEGFYSYFPLTGPSTAYDELAIVCEVTVE